MKQTHLNYLLNYSRMVSRTVVQMNNSSNGGSSNRIASLKYLKKKRIWNNIVVEKKGNDQVK